MFSFLWKHNRLYTGPVLPPRSCWMGGSPKGLTLSFVVSGIDSDGVDTSDVTTGRIVSLSLGSMAANFSSSFKLRLVWMRCRLKSSVDVDLEIVASVKPRNLASASSWKRLVMFNDWAEQTPALQIQKEVQVKKSRTTYLKDLDYNPTFLRIHS